MYSPFKSKSKTDQNLRKTNSNINENQQIALVLGLRVVFGIKTYAKLPWKSSTKTAPHIKLVFPVNKTIESEKTKSTANEKRTDINKTINSMLVELERCGVIFNYSIIKKISTKTIAMKKITSLNLFVTDKWKSFANGVISVVQQMHQTDSLKNGYFLINDRASIIIRYYNEHSNDYGKSLIYQNSESLSVFNSFSCSENNQNSMFISQKDNQEFTQNTPLNSSFSRSSFPNFNLNFVVKSLDQSNSSKNSFCNSIPLDCCYDGLISCFYDNLSTQ